MENIFIKKQEYEVIDKINNFTFLVKKDNQEYLAYVFSDDKTNFSNFKFAYKRLKNCGITIPKLFEIDKKNLSFLVENIKGKTVLEELLEHYLDEKIIEEAFTQNYKARVNRLRLDFDPINFKYVDNKLYYLPFTFTEYIRDKDFSSEEFKYWIYTKDFVSYLRSKGLPINQSRVGNEYETNKKMVLLVVKYFR